MARDLITGIPGWKTASKHAVRAAISPFFTPPYVEPVHDEADRHKMNSLIQSGVSCATCGRSKASVGGSGLLKCARCHQIMYYWYYLLIVGHDRHQDIKTSKFSAVEAWALDFEDVSGEVVVGAVVFKVLARQGRVVYRTTASSFLAYHSSKL